MAERHHAHIIANNITSGGAARAAARIADSLADQGEELGLGVTVRVAQGRRWLSEEAAVLPGGVAKVRRVASYWRSALRSRRTSPHKGPVHSRADIWTGVGRETNRLAPDVVNLHWIGDGTISIEEVGAIRAPKVLTLHDMWYFCGSEHIAADEGYTDGYATAPDASRLNISDWNRHTWLRKRNSWLGPMHVIAASNWMAERCRESALMGDWPTHVVPNPIDPSRWYPAEKARSRAMLGLPQDAALVLFGAVGGFGQSLKGGGLLLGSLAHLPLRMDLSEGASDIHLVTFGGRNRLPESALRSAHPVHDLGPIVDDESLRAVYSAADVTVVPSRVENLSNVACESHACGTPVVAFDVGGFRDIVTDGVDGRLVPPFDVQEMARAILWSLDPTRSSLLHTASRVSAVRFEPARVAAAYADVYRKVMGSGRAASRMRDWWSH